MSGIRKMNEVETTPEAVAERMPGLSEAAIRSMSGCRVVAADLMPQLAALRIALEDRNGNRKSVYLCGGQVFGIGF